MVTLFTPQVYLRRLIARCPRKLATPFLAGALLALQSCAKGPEIAPLKERNLTQLNQRLANIDSELEQLATLRLRGGAGAVGYRSKKYHQPDMAELIHIELDEICTIDQIALVPALWRDSKSGVRSEGFPLKFRILAGTNEKTDVVYTFSAEDQLAPRTAPLTVSFPAVVASSISIEVTRLSPDIGEEKYSLQLSEIMVFSGLENVALQKNVSIQFPGTSKPYQYTPFLTDGFSPYLMDAAEGSRSSTQIMRVAEPPQSPPTLTLDLQAPYPVNQINLHTASAVYSIPMSFFTCWAVPRHVRVTGANHPDFKDETVLFEHEQHSIRDTGPVIMRRFPKSLARYIRITILDHRPVVWSGPESPKIAFTEIEVLAEGRNVALNAPIIATPNLHYANEPLPRMTDGLNYYGKILPVRTWMNQLARRHDLETERLLLVPELNKRYERQKANLHILAWAVALLSTGTIVTFLIGQALRQRAIFRTRERIAANLHDELGANLHAIGLFGELAKQEVADAEAHEKWSQLVCYVDEVRSLTEQAGKTARYTTNMLEAKELYENLADEMRRTTEQLLTDLQHQIIFTNEEMLQQLPPRKRIGLFLFYKECLTNIIRHSGATQVEAHLSASKKEILLSVRDNGHGLAEGSKDTAPASLKRRARLLNARLSTETPPDGGTLILLKLKPRRWSFLRN